MSWGCGASVLLIAAAPHRVHQRCIWLVGASLLAAAWATPPEHVQKLLAKGVIGYDLYDKLDKWYGQGDPPYDAPFRILDALGTKDDQVTKDDWLAIKLPAEHFEYFDKNKDGHLDTHEANSWHQQRQPARNMNLSEVHDPPKGHLQRLGSWKDPLPSDDLVYHKPYPHPRDFWKKHMDGYLPAVLKGAQAGWPAMSWTKESLVERFGWVEAKLEPKIESRGNDSAYEDLETLSEGHRMNLSRYIEIEEGKNMYVVSIIPQVMAWEVAHPAVLLCGSRRKMVNKRSPPPYKLKKHSYPHEDNLDWMTHIFEANLWMASGKTNSQFHYDKEWNVNCLLSGRKRWFFLNPFWYHDQVQWARGGKFKPDDPLNNGWTDWVFLDAAHTDLIVQNRLRTMDYYELIQEPGDCIFIPYAMLHQVEKLDDSFQVAVSWMFLPETIYDEEDCQGAPLDEDLPLATMDVLYAYNGTGLIPQGYMDPLHMVKSVDELMRLSKQQHLTLKTFTRAVTREEAILRSLPGREAKIKAIYDELTHFAADPEKGLTRSELSKIPLRVWSKPAAEGDSEGPLPCDHGQEYVPYDKAEVTRMKEYLQAQLAAQAQKPKAAAPEARTPLTHQRLWPGKPTTPIAKKDEL